VSEPPPPLRSQDVHLLKQKETPAQPTQVWTVPKEPASLVQKESILQFSPMASVDKEADKPLQGEWARALTELMKASPLGSMSMSSEPASARQRPTGVFQVTLDIPHRKTFCFIQFQPSQTPLSDMTAQAMELSGKVRIILKAVAEGSSMPG